MRTHSLRRAMVVVLIGCVLVGGCTRSTLEDQVGPPSGGAVQFHQRSAAGPRRVLDDRRLDPVLRPVDLGAGHQRARRQRRHPRPGRTRLGAAA